MIHEEKNWPITLHVKSIADPPSRQHKVTVTREWHKVAFWLEDYKLIQIETKFCLPDKD